MGPRVALLCSGLGHVRRGHEAFASGLFELLSDSLDLTLFKGGGEPGPRQWVIDNLPRASASLQAMHLPVSPKWMDAAREQECLRIECETFAFAAMKPLLDGGFDVVHCLEQEVCNVVAANRHLFRKPPKILFSNGGAIPARELPRCDFVQEHTAHNLATSDRKKAFLIPHGVDLTQFRPGIATDFRARHGIPAGARLVLSVGTVCFWHKRMDHLIREVARVPDLHLAIVGQESPDSADIRALGRELMKGRIVFDTLPHARLPEAYAAANVFALASLFETFGIVYVEAMAMGLPVICTNHVNQRSIVKEGLFVDMKKPGALTEALTRTDPATFTQLGRRGREIAAEHYSLQTLKQMYLDRYAAIAASPLELPTFDLKRQVAANLRNVVRHTARLIHGQAE